MMIAYTTKDKVPTDVVFLPAQAQVYGELYLGSKDELNYLDEQKRTQRVPDTNN